MTCYLCRNIAQYRLIAVHTSWWRRVFELGPKQWLTCAEHRYDPICAGHRSRIHQMARR